MLIRLIECIIFDVIRVPALGGQRKKIMKILTMIVLSLNNSRRQKEKLRKRKKTIKLLRKTKGYVSTLREEGVSLDYLETGQMTHKSVVCGNIPGSAIDY